MAGKSINSSLNVDSDGDIIEKPWGDIYDSEDETKPVQPGGVNVALNKTAQASGSENDGMQVIN